MKFSERMGITPKKAIQLKSMDGDLRNGLWNIVYIYFLEDINEFVDVRNCTRYSEFFDLWTGYFKLSIDNIPSNGERAFQIIKKKYGVIP